MAEILLSSPGSQALVIGQTALKDAVNAKPIPSVPNLSDPINMKREFVNALISANRVAKSKLEDTFISKYVQANGVLGRALQTPQAVVVNPLATSTLKRILKTGGFDIHPTAARLLRTQLPNIALLKLAKANAQSANRTTITSEDVSLAIISLDRELEVPTKDTSNVINDPKNLYSHPVNYSTKYARDFVSKVRASDGKRVTTLNYGFDGKQRVMGSAGGYYIKRRNAKTNFIRPDDYATTVEKARDSKTPEQKFDEAIAGNKGLVIGSGSNYLFK